jgi:hypothetical protein
MTGVSVLYPYTHCALVTISVTRDFISDSEREASITARSLLDSEHFWERILSEFEFTKDFFFEVFFIRQLILIKQV